MTWLNLVELSKLPQFAEIMNQVTGLDKGTDLETQTYLGPFFFKGLFI